jgi:hypothetical protein
MFATQQYMDATLETPRKRIREDEEDLINGISSFSEHRNKRLQSLPVRTSPRASQQILPASLAPQNSVIDDQAFSSWPQQDAEVDMMDTASAPAVHPQVHAARFPDVDTNGNGATGRLPTPIQPSFAAQIRGQQCEWAGPGPTVTPNGVANLGHHVTGIAGQQNTPRVLSNDADWHNVQSNRRLPSPISEAEDPAMQQHMHNAPNSQQSYMEHPGAGMDVEAITHVAHAHDSEGEASSSPDRRSMGHMRSKHTINNWTWQPGMKKSFSIGYRADCEKCRLKVPGHFNHIIIS